MAQERLLHIKRISTRKIRELHVYYDKGGLNYLDYSMKQRAIFFASTIYDQEEGSIWKTLTVGLGQSKPGIG